MTEEPITDSETTGEQRSFEPHESKDNGQSAATIVHNEGSVVVSGFTFIEDLQYEYELPYLEKTIRVWYSDPKDDDSDYTDYEGATITEISP